MTAWKIKGAAKDFEMVRGHRQVIVLDEFDGQELWEDDWEEIYDESAQAKQSYADALRQR